MAEPINHDTGSEFATAGWESAKGAAKWGLGIPLAVGAVAAVATIGWGLGAALAIGAVATVATAAFGAPLFAPLAALGAALGLAKGGSRIAKEKEAFREHVEAHKERREHKTERKINDAAIAGMQEGYALGFQEGQQHVVNGIQQAVMQQQAAAMQGQAADAPKSGGFADRVTCKCESKAEAIVQERQANAAAGHQI